MTDQEPYISPRLAAAFERAEQRASVRGGRRGHVHTRDGWRLDVDACAGVIDDDEQ